MRKVYYILSALICTGAVADIALYTAFHTGELTPDLYGRTDLNIPGGRVVDNMFVWPHGPIEKRRGTYFIAEVAEGELEAEVPGAPSDPATYTMTFIGENGTVSGIPLGDGAMLTALDDGGAAVDVGGGIVALPMAGHPFEVGQKVRISFTTNYNGDFTLEAGTTNDELQITDSFVAETFDASERVIREIASLVTGGGDMVGDSDGNLWYGHNWSVANDTYITQIEPDGTLVEDFFNHDNWPLGRTTSNVRGLALSADEEFIYIYTNTGGTNGYVSKYSLLTGNKAWDSVVSVSVGYDISVDADGDAYIALVGEDMIKLDSDDGSQTSLTLMGRAQTISPGAVGGLPYVSVVAQDMGLVIVAGQIHTSTSRPEDVLYNLAVRTFDDSVGDQIVVGNESVVGAIRSTPRIGTTGVAVSGDFIYVMCADPTLRLFKISWDGSDLAVDSAVTGPTHGQGIYFDLYGNLVVVNQSAGTPQSEVFHYYDTDLNLLGTIDGFTTSLLRTWASPVGGAWISGGVVFDGALAGADTPLTPAVVIPPVAEGEIPARLLSFETNIIEAGHEYMRFYRETP